MPRHDQWVERSFVVSSQEERAGCSGFGLLCGGGGGGGKSKVAVNTQRCRERRLETIGKEKTKERKGQPERVWQVVLM